MSKENGMKTKEEVSKTIEKMARPWIGIGENAPGFSVKEVARTTRISPSKITDSILEKDGIIFSVQNNLYSLFLEDIKGDRVDGNIDSAAKKSAPSIRAVRQSRYLSRKPGGGPVIKARVLNRNLGNVRLRLGRERLTIKMEPLAEDPEERKRRETKERLILRGINRYGGSLEPNFQEKTEESMKIEQDILRVMTYLSSLEKTNAVNKPTISERIKKSRQDDSQLILFVPWGVRPAGEIRLEFSVIEKLQNVKNQLNKFGVKAQILIMTADSYATEINKQVDPDAAIKYFSSIQAIAQENDFDYTTWSRIRKENFVIYQKLFREITEDTIRETIDQETISGALKSSARRSGNFSRRAVEQAAFAYMRERLIEGQLIDAVYKPIKVSAVVKYKDSLDGPLPRIYVIPQEEQFPWLK